MEMKKKKLYLEAQKVILGGNSLLSKNPNMLLPKGWPTYFKKAHKVNVWDINGKKYIDMMCLVGQSILGYSNKELDQYLFKKSRDGIITSLNCPEEVFLAKKLIKIHPWAQMAKFARSGGEANALAARIARAATGRDHIAICGYHGWHDWYLSVNLKDKNNLSKFLLPGLEPHGVPKALKNTCHTFQSNDLSKLKKIIQKFRPAAIYMEVARNRLPDKDNLKKIRKLADKNKILLIFDECTTGFRRNLGGLHLTTGVNPDLAMFGKALGNGYAITCVLGRKKYMKIAEKSFISSTFWSERLGYLAAIKTLDILKKKKPYNNLIKIGKMLNKSWEILAKQNDLKISITGIETITSFSFTSKNNLLYKTYITQEMLKKGYLASNVVYLNIHHTKKIIKNYLKNLSPIFNQISLFEKGILKKLPLNSPICNSKFERINDH